MFAGEILSVYTYLHVALPANKYEGRMVEFLAELRIRIRSDPYDLSGSKVQPSFLKPFLIIRN